MCVCFFTTVLKDLVIIPVHTKPDDSDKELDELYDVFQNVKKKWRTDVRKLTELTVQSNNNKLSEEPTCTSGDGEAQLNWEKTQFNLDKTRINPSWLLPLCISQAAVVLIIIKNKLKERN